jgi:hypothetical protein
MSRLFTSGFEGFNLTSIGWTATAGTAPTITTTTPHSGTYVLETAATAAQSNVRADLVTSIAAGKYTWTRFYFRGADVTPGTNTIIARSTSSGAVVAWTVTLNTDGTLTLTNGVTSTTASITTALANDTWYRILVYHFIDNTAGQLNLWLYLGNSTTELDRTPDITGEDTLPANVGRWYFGKLSAVAGTYLYDDIAIVDDVAGNGETGTDPGPGNTYLAVPNFDGTPAQWTPSTGSDHYAVINDLPGTPNDTAYLSTAVTSNEDWFYLTSAPAAMPANAIIKCVDVSARAHGNATTPDMRVAFYDGTTRTDGPTATLTTSAAALTMRQHLVVRPTSHTKTNAASYSIAIESLSSLDTRVTALWINVEWIESSVPVASPVTHKVLMTA